MVLDESWWYMMVSYIKKCKGFPTSHVFFTANQPPDPIAIELQRLVWFGMANKRWILPWQRVRHIMSSILEIPRVGSVGVRFCCDFFQFIMHQGRLFRGCAGFSLLCLLSRWSLRTGGWDSAIGYLQNESEKLNASNTSEPIPLTTKAQSSEQITNAILEPAPGLSTNRTMVKQQEFIVEFAVIQTNQKNSMFAARLQGCHVMPEPYGRGRTYAQSKMIPKQPWSLQLFCLAPPFFNTLDNLIVMA